MSGNFTISQMVKRWEDANRVVHVALKRLTLRPNDVKALVGPSGCGKSTVLDMLALALKPDSLESYVIENSGSPLNITDRILNGAQEALARLRARSYGYVVQTGALLPFLTVQENIELPQKLSGRHEIDRVHTLVERLGLGETLNAYPAKLSVGQRQRVAVARALSHRPDFVLLDEPTAALDPATAEEVLATCLAFAKDMGACTLIVSHDHDLVDRFGIQKISIETRSEGREWWTDFADDDRAAATEAS